MNKENWQKLNELFSEAIEIAPDERAVFIDSIEDREIRAELESLLKSHDDSNKFLNKSAVEISARTLLENDGENLIGKVIGQFKIIKEIGRGGMGAVYLAERIGADFTQKAALKLIKRGMDTDFIIQRFQTERRILSKLNHPFIAKLLDGGTTGDGLPYFVMEFIEGENLKEFCKNQRLSATEKLKLFRQICEAVQYAHRNLVIHRDLKPSNIIITEDGTPKLLDFGIAKVLDNDTENTEKTTTEFRLLTPKYASPEQIRGEIVDTQSDVFSLGVLLREILEELDLPKPDTQKSKTATQNTKTSSELKTIINKAVHETTSRRYVSVEQFSEDLRRYEMGLPILAQPDSFGYRTQKFVLRHRFGVFAAGLVFLTLLGGIAATLWQFQRAQTERKLAEQRFADVRGLANSVIFDLHDEIQNLPGSTKARKLLVEKALEYLNKLEQDAGNDAGLQHELAMAYTKIADVQGQIFEQSLLETDNAAKNYRKALELAEKAISNDSGNFEFRRDLALICYRFAEFQRGGNDLTETLALENRAAQLYEPLVKENPSDPDIRRRWLVARNGYTEVLRESGELEKSLPLYDQILNDTIAATREFPSDVRLQRFIAVVYGSYARGLFQHEDKKKALEYILIAKDIGEKALAVDPSNTYTFRGNGVTCEAITKYASAIGNNDLAETNGLEGIQIMEKVSKDDPENLEANYDVASLHNTFSDFLEDNNRLQEAFKHRQKVLEAILPLEKNEDNPDLYTADFFEFYCKFARIAARLGKKELAGIYVQKAENLNFQIEKTTGEVQNLYSNNFVALGETYQFLGNQEKAKANFAKAVETWKNLQTNGRLYLNQVKNLTEAEQKLKQ
ncbi:MAG: serine/threonine protein kinase [Pyrinomonadaceae bacterium]|nr:serine/threonine protein kinase [Pyrinomonadaceae bacterium]